MIQNQQAFAPGHISGFFEPVIFENDANRTGSRGSGLSISLGATSSVSVQPAKTQEIITYINMEKILLPVTSLTIQKLIGSSPLKIHVNTQLDLPIGQGFGMSAAGALSAALALTKILNIPTEKALAAAHFAEVNLHTGLGDAIGSSFGGIEIRREAGLPPWGSIEHIPGSYQVVLCIVDKEIPTHTILTNPSQMEKIKYFGQLCINKIVETPTVEMFFNLSKWFAQQTGLLSPKVSSALDAVRDFGQASQCMLGNSIFAIGNTDQLIQCLSIFGSIYVGSVDIQGARVI